ncbi:MAG: patatin-like phospholipase family protein [Clostridia bacterium]|nr:patatin-like phospholipase family protein [Clostridia bacterium]
MKKLGFALGAGGARGVAHVGFLQAMEEAGIVPDYITGCSMGSVVGAAYAAGVSVETMRKATCSLRWFDLIAPTKKRGGLFDTWKMRRMLSHYLGDVTFDELKIPYHCIAVDMITQSVVEFSEGSVLDAVVASSSIPSLFRPTEKDGKRLIDGGILERVPFEQVKKMGADVVVAVDVLGWRECKEEMPGTIGVLLEMLDIMDNHRTRRRHKENEDIIDFWLEPELGDMSQYSFKKFDFAYEKGYELGKANAEKIKAALQ